MKILAFVRAERLATAMQKSLADNGHTVVCEDDSFKVYAGLTDKTKRFDVFIVCIDDETCAQRVLQEYVGLLKKPHCICVYSRQNSKAGFMAAKLGADKLVEIAEDNMQQLAESLMPLEPKKYTSESHTHVSKEYNECIRNLQNQIKNHHSVLLIGEAGVGKSFLAEHIHNDLSNSDYKYAEVKCDEIVNDGDLIYMCGVARGYTPEIKRDRKGFLDKANERGLLYLEHIHKLPPKYQDVLMDVIETGEYTPVGSDTPRKFTATIIASCHDRLDIHHRGFNAKLFRYFMANAIQVPTLRECNKDIITLAEQIIQRYCERKRIQQVPVLMPCAKIKMLTYDWPGNITELVHCVESAVARCKDGRIMEKEIHFSEHPKDSLEPRSRRRELIDYLIECAGKKIKVAEAMKVSRPTLDRLIEQFQIDVSFYKRSCPSTKKRRKRA